MNPIWPGRRRPGVPLKVMPDAHSSINNQALPLEKCKDREVSQVAQRSAFRKTADRPVEATDECRTARGTAQRGSSHGPCLDPASRMQMRPISWGGGRGDALAEAAPAVAHPQALPG